MDFEEFINIKQRKTKVNQKYRDYIKTLPCLISDKDCCGWVHVHHVRTVGAGGLDEYNLVPLCMDHHTGNHGVHVFGKIKFSKKYDVNLTDIATLLYHEWMKI